MSSVVRLAVIPGDGIGPEVVAEAVKVLDAVVDPADVVFEKTYFELGAARYLATGDVLTDDDLDVINGKQQQLEGKIQERYGYAKDKAKQEVDSWYNRQQW